MASLTRQTTLRELHEIEDAIIGRLRSIRHQRLAYPDDQDEAASSRVVFLIPSGQPIILLAKPGECQPRIIGMLPFGPRGFASIRESEHLDPNITMGGLMPDLAERAAFF